MLGCEIENAQTWQEDAVLGPALTEMLHRIASMPNGKRTVEQEKVLHELGLLFAAFPGDPTDATPETLALHEDLRSAIKMKPDLYAGVTIAGITPPIGAAPGKTCPICGYKPVT
jgi:hypothetical protein